LFTGSYEKRRSPPVVGLTAGAATRFQVFTGISKFDDGGGGGGGGGVPVAVGSSIFVFETISSSYQVYAVGWTSDPLLPVWNGVNHTFPYFASGLVFAISY
jgi:hypothetical protein